MSFCKNCGTQLPDNTQFCSNCGATQSATQITPMQQPASYTSAPAEKDEKSIGLNILAWFIPLVGLIMYFCNRKEKPIRSKSMLKTAIISIVVNFVIVIISTVLIFAGTFATIKSSADALGGISSDVGGNSSDVSYEYALDVGKENEEKTTELTTELTTQSDKPSVNSSSDWTDYTVSVNGSKITLPMSYKDFTSKTKTKFDDPDDAECTLKPNYFTVVTMKDNSGKQFCVEIINTGNSVATYNECIIAGISDFKRYGDNGQADLVFAGNLKIGDKVSEDEFKQLFGEPDDTWYSDDEEQTYKYTYYEDYDKYWGNRKFTITVYDGIINDLDIEKSA